jgi:hypothetical protein
VEEGEAAGPFGAPGKPGSEPSWEGGRLESIPPTPHRGREGWPSLRLPLPKPSQRHPHAERKGLLRHSESRHTSLCAARHSCQRDMVSRLPTHQSYCDSPPLPPNHLPPSPPRSGIFSPPRLLPLGLQHAPRQFLLFLLRPRGSLQRLRRGRDPVHPRGRDPIPGGRNPPGWGGAGRPAFRREGRPASERVASLPLGWGGAPPSRAASRSPVGAPSQATEECAPTRSADA